MIHTLVIGIDSWSEYRTLDGVYLQKIKDCKAYIRPGERGKHFVTEIRDEKGKQINQVSTPEESWAVGHEVVFEVQP